MKTFVVEALFYRVDRLLGNGEVKVVLQAMMKRERR